MFEVGDKAIFIKNGSYSTKIPSGAILEIVNIGLDRSFLVVYDKRVYLVKFEELKELTEVEQLLYS